jgi:UDP-N-acetyl-D-mannosaminuronic acid transferase (WecB/TagA/CpsF family)
VIAVPAHCIVECLRSEKLRQVYNRAGMVTPDGKPIAWICKLCSDLGAKFLGHRQVPTC